MTVTWTWALVPAFIHPDRVAVTVPAAWEHVPVVGATKPQDTKVVSAGSRSVSVTWCAAPAVGPLARLRMVTV